MDDRLSCHQSQVQLPPWESWQSAPTQALVATPATPGSEGA